MEPRAEATRMPAGYGVPTDGSGGEVLPWSWAEEQLTRARNYWICTTHADGRPHTAPVWGLWLDGAVWFGTSPASAKGRNMARDPRIVVHLESGDDVVILEGEVELPDDPDLQARVADAYEEKYRHRPPRLFAMRPRVAQTWTESDFPRNATRWVFDQA
jgi:PPOX class probable F420-dependent enzyme